MNKSKRDIKNVAIILAAGSGKRFGANLPKQYIRLGGKEIIVYTIEQFEKNELIDEICLVINLDYKKDIEKIIKKYNFKKVKKIISGGKERYESSYNAILEYEKEGNINIIFHDGVRPFVSQEIITDTIKALDKYNAVDVAIESSDTIIEVNKDCTIKNIPNRSQLRRGQTPQAFKLFTIKKAHTLARLDKKKINFTDDCGIVLEYLKDEKIFVIKGEKKNIKITHKEDLLLAEKLLQLNSYHLNKSFNRKKLEKKVIVVFGGSSGIGKEICNIANKSGGYVYSFSKSNGYDIRSIRDVEKSLNSVYEKHKKINYIINCAGVLIKSDIKDVSQEVIDESIDVNFKGCVNIAQASFKYLKDSKGMLLFFASSSYTRGRAHYSLYSASKAAVVNFTQALDEEWKDFNIRVNCINPARTLTPMRVRNFGKEDSSTLLSAKDVAIQALAILSEEISGQIIDIKKDIL
jgi:2-C-methyl-D-erythritol 4-phosphate cytidylyltransferase